MLLIRSRFLAANVGFSLGPSVAWQHSAP